MKAETRQSALLLCLCLVVSLPGAVLASLDSPSLKLPGGLKPSETWRPDIILEAQSPSARLRLTKLGGLKSIADHFDLNGRDADRLSKQGAVVQKRLRAFTTAGGRRLLAIESVHRDKTLFTGYVNGPKNTYAFLASGLPLADVVSAVETLRFPGEEIKRELDPLVGAQRAKPSEDAALPMPEELRDAVGPAEEPVPNEPAPMFEKQQPSPWPDRFKTLFGWTMLLIGIGFVWRLVSWAGDRKSRGILSSPRGKPAPGSAAALTPLPPFKRFNRVTTTPLPLPKRETVSV